MKSLVLTLLLTLMPLHAGACIETHNPGNLVKTGSLWKGQTKSEGRFIAFESAHYGLRALAVVLLRYESRHGLTSVEDIIGRFAPAHENNTAKYATFVANHLGVSVQEDIEVQPHLVLLMQAIVQYENGSQPYSVDQLYCAAIEGLEHVRNNP